MSYALNTLVSKEEQNALKDMIFKRAQERADSLNQEVQENYTSNIRNELMYSARNSFVSKKNPFSLNQTPEDDVNNFSAKEKIIKNSKNNIDEIKAKIYSHNKSTKAEISESTKLETMNDARADFERKASFMGALNFLNSQASISLIRNKGSNFEALA